MENILTSTEDSIDKPSTNLKPFSKLANLNKILIAIIISSVVLGVFTGYSLSKKSGGLAANLPAQQAKTAIQDTRTFKDFAEGTLKVRPAPKNPNEYVEGSHLLVRDGAYPVALTSSVVDLSQYDGKKVKVYGETQKALKEGWLMDVGRVEEIK